MQSTGGLGGQRVVKQARHSTLLMALSKIEGLGSTLVEPQAFLERTVLLCLLCVSSDREGGGVR